MSDETREAVARAIEHWFVENSGFGVIGTDVEKPTVSASYGGRWVDLRTDRIANAALSGLRLGSRLTVEGVECVVVPSTPHPDQTAAGWDALDEKSSGVLTEDDIHEDAIDGIYRAMLRACEEKGDGR